MSRLTSRRTLLRSSAALGLTGSLLAAAGRGNSAGGQERDPILSCIDWQLAVHPVIFSLGDEFGVEIEVGSSAGFGFDRFVVEKNQGYSTWDAYSGVTPFVEMKPLADTETIEPWDPYLPDSVRSDFFPAALAEGTYNGSMYVWPLLLDITIQAWHAGVVDRAGLDPGVAPATWDEFISFARQVQDRGAAAYGCVFDHRDWRSLIPLTHSFDTNVYSPEGLFLYNSDAAVNALEVMKQLMEVTSPDILSDSDSAGTVVDETIWASEQAGYYVKYQNAPLRQTDTWNDPTQLRMSRLPFQPGAAGGTVFWNTGGVMLKHGSNKAAMAEFMLAMSVDERIWKNSLTGNPEHGTSPIGQLPALQSVWAGWEANPPDFLESASWVFSVLDSLASARAIQPTALAISQFDVARPEWQKYLSGAETSARTALTRAYDAVRAEYLRQTGTSAT